MNIRIVSPAGSIKSRVVDGGVNTLKSWGHSVTVAPHALDAYGRFAGIPEDRAQDIIEALQDPNVDLIWATRGGYGCMQILNLIPLELVRKANKPIVGYSDITALHALWSKAGVKSLHAPMMKHLGEDPTHRTTKTLKEVIDYYGAHRCFPPKHNNLFLKKLNEQYPDRIPFDAETVSLVGGNLSVLSGLHGTSFDYDYEGKVLFIEDISESPYKIDRMVQQLKLMGVFSKVKALVCGHFTGCDEDPLMPIKLWDNIRWIVSPSGIPVLMGAPIGHELENYPVVIG